jgi:hypothetical protein
MKSSQGAEVIVKGLEGNFSENSDMNRRVRTAILDRRCKDNLRIDIVRFCI